MHKYSILLFLYCMVYMNSFNFIFRIIIIIIIII